MQSLLRAGILVVVLISSFVARSQPWVRITTLPQKSYYAFETIGANLYAGTTDTMYYSKDKGATWTMRKLPIAGYHVTAFTFFSGRLFVGTEDGAFMTGDDGLSWAPSNIHIGINQFVQWQGNLYAATQGGGVFICSQVSNTWSPFNINLSTTTSGNLIRIIDDGTTLATATRSNGSWLRYYTATTQWKEYFFNGASADPTFIVYDFIKDGSAMFVQTNNGWLLRSDDTGSHWTADATDMRGGKSGVLLTAYSKFYAIWNDSGGAWIQSRDRSEGKLSSWANGEEFFTSGQVRAAREFNRMLILATDNGVYWKDNGSPALSVAATATSDVEVFPNPTIKGAATIKATGLSRVQVYDVMSRLVQDHALNASQFQLQISEPGIYNLKLQVQGHWVSRRLQVL